MTDDDFDIRSFAEEDDLLPSDEAEEEEEKVDSILDEGLPSTPFLGMTPMERMFLSIFLFVDVAILGVALLLATNRI